MLKRPFFVLLAVASQVNELNIIRQSLYDLETQHGKIQQHYEEEITRARAESRAAAAAVAQAAAASSSSGTSQAQPGQSDTHSIHYMSLCHGFYRPCTTSRCRRPRRSYSWRTVFLSHYGSTTWSKRRRWSSFRNRACTTTARSGCRCGWASRIGCFRPWCTCGYVPGVLHPFCCAGWFSG